MTVADTTALLLNVHERTRADSPQDVMQAMYYSGRAEERKMYQESKIYPKSRPSGRHLHFFPLDLFTLLGILVDGTPASCTVYSTL